MAALIGAARVDLGINSAAFEKGIDSAEKRIAGLSKTFTNVGTRIANVGLGLTASITAPFTALIATAIPAATESAQALAQVNAALASMGPVAGRTTAQLQAAAGTLQDLSNFDDDDILKAVTANLLTFGKVTGATFDRAQLAAVNLSARLGQDLQSSAIQVGKALNDPIKGVTALQRVGVSFTAQQREQIKAMTEAGNVAGAQGIILGELEKQFGGAAKAQRDATPTAALQESWRNFQEAIGGIAIKVLPPFTAALQGVLDAFNNLSPGAQNVALATAAIAAAAGPVLTTFGGLVKLGAPLLATFAEGGVLASGLGALPALLGPVGIAAAGVYLAFQNWDKIGPYFDGLVARATKAADDIDAKLASIQHGADDVDKRLGVPSKDDFLTSVQAAAAAVYDAIDAKLRGLQKLADDTDAMFARWGTAIGATFTAVVSSAEQLYRGVANWIGDKLTAVLAKVEAPVRAVGDFFHGMWDRVVGHSYVPDMVDAIEAHFARLEHVMVAPARQSAEDVARAFQAANDDILATVDRTQIAIRNTKFSYADYLTAEKQRPADEAAEAAAMRDRTGLGASVAAIDAERDKKLAAKGLIGGVATDRLQQAGGILEAVAKTLGGPIADGIEKITGCFGEFRGVALGTIDDVLGQLAQRLGGAGDVGGLVSGLVGKVVGHGWLGKIVSSAAGALAQGYLGAKLPHLATGGTIGGLAGVDRNLLSINGMPAAMVGRGETLRVAPANDTARAPTIEQHFHYSGAVDVADKTFVLRVADAARAAAIAGIRDQDRRRG